MIQRTYQNRWWVFFGFFSFGQLWSCFFCRHLGFWTPKFNDFPSNFLCNANGVCGAVTDTRDRDPRHSGARWMMAISMRKAWYSKVGIERRNFLSRTPPTGYNSKVQPSKFHISPLKNDGTGRRSGFLLGPGQFLGAYGKLLRSIDGIEKKILHHLWYMKPLENWICASFRGGPLCDARCCLSLQTFGSPKMEDSGMVALEKLAPSRVAVSVSRGIVTIDIDI